MPGVEDFPSGFYAWQGRKPSCRAMQNAVLTERFRASHAASDGTYGRDRIRAESHDQGLVANHKRIARLMQLAGVRGVSRWRGYVVTTRREAGQARTLIWCNGALWRAARINCGSPT